MTPREKTTYLQLKHNTLGPSILHKVPKSLTTIKKEDANSFGSATGRRS